VGEASTIYSEHAEVDQQSISSGRFTSGAGGAGNLTRSRKVKKSESAESGEPSRQSAAHKRYRATGSLKSARTDISDEWDGRASLAKIALRSSRKGREKGKDFPERSSGRNLRTAAEPTEDTAMNSSLRYLSGAAACRSIRQNNENNSVNCECGSYRITMLRF